MKPEQALEIIVSILNRAPITAAEQYALTAAIKAINEAIAPKQE